MSRAAAPAPRPLRLALPHRRTTSPPASPSPSRTPYAYFPPIAGSSGLPPLAPLSPLSSGLPSPTFPSRPASPSPLRTTHANIPTPPPVSVSLKQNDKLTRKRTRSVESVLPVVEDILCEGDRIGAGLVLLGERIRPVQLGLAAVAGAPLAPLLEVVRKIGEGSNACVYLVREVLNDDGAATEEDEMVGMMELDGERRRGKQSIEYGREFAVKCLSKKNLSKEQIEMQLGEAKIHQSLSPHPNIVTLHRTLETSSWLLLVLEHVPGEDLFYFLEQARDHDHVLPLTPPPDSEPSSPGSSSGSSHTLHPGPLSHTPRTPSLLASCSPSSLLSTQRLRLITRMFQQMCAAVAFCHANGVAHRDIKPENFIVTDARYCTADGERRVVVKLTDFGLASRATESRDVDCGSAPYMSFECANNVAPTYLTQPADVWSLGIVLVNMLYHMNPWTRAMPGMCDAYDEFVRAPVDFWVQRFPGVTKGMAEFLAGKVFCPAEGRVGARELGEWVSGLSGMMDAEEAGIGRGRKLSAGNASAETDVFVDVEPEVDNDNDERSSTPSSREPSIIKRRKRGARANKDKAKTPASTEIEDNDAALVAVQALAREVSMVGKGGGRSRASSERRPGADDDEPAGRIMLPGRSPGALDMLPSPLRPRPSMDDDTWRRGRQPGPSRFGLSAATSSWRNQPNPTPPLPGLPTIPTVSGLHMHPAYASSAYSASASTLSTYNTLFSNGSVRSVSTMATTVSDPLSVRGGSSAADKGKGREMGYTGGMNIDPNASVSSFAPSWTRQSNGSMRSVATIATSASDPNVPMRSAGGALVDKGKQREYTSAAPVSMSGPVPPPLRGPVPATPPRSSPLATASPSPSRPRNATNVKRIEGMPAELSGLPRQPFMQPRPPKTPPEAKRPSRKPPASPNRLDPIAERTRRPSSPLFQRRDASTSTTSLDEPALGTHHDPASPPTEHAPKKVNKGQINALGKLLSGLRSSR